MNSENYRAVDSIKQAIGSIARLGRAASVHLALAAQRASGGTISSDLKNNIQMSVLLGAFDSGASTLMFEKDISNLAKPEIKGRGFIQTGNSIIETQTYFTKPEHDWEFDLSMKATYSNPVFLEQMKKQNKEPDMGGFVEQHPLDFKPEPANNSAEQVGVGSADLFDDEDEGLNDAGLAEEIIEVVDESDEAPQIEFKFGQKKVSTNQSVREKLSELNIEVTSGEDEQENKPQKLKLNAQKQTIKLKRG